MNVILELDPLRVSLTGIGRYTLELALGLRDSGELGDLKYQFLLGWADSPEALIDKYHGEARQKGGKRSGLVDWAYRAMRAGFWAVSPSVKAAICRPYRDYIYHSPSFSLPNFSGRCVNTIHDMSVFRVPQFHPADRVAYQKRVVPGVMRRGDLFLTDSEFSRSELLSFFDVPEDRVVSVPLGVDASFRPLIDSEAEHLALGKFGLRAGEYCLSVGTIEPRKNIERLIDAYALLPNELRRKFPLVLAGGYGWNSQAIHQKICKCAAEGWLIYLAYVSETDLPLLYAGARLFSCVSLYEGFGLPVLEAMASGVPVVCSNVSSLPEVGGEAVCYVSPTDLDSIRFGIENLLVDTERSEFLRLEGLRRAQSFTWARTVQATLTAYRAID